jgi:hypothetical protein
MRSAVNGRWKPFTNASSPGQTRSWRSLGEIASPRVRRSAVFSPRWISLPLSPCAPSCLQELLARPQGKEEQSGGMFGRQENHYLVFDVDGTREAASPRALPKTADRPAPKPRLRPLCAPGYTGGKRGEVVRSRTTVLKAHTHQWIATFGNPGSGSYRVELRRAVSRPSKAISRHITIPRSMHSCASTDNMGRELSSPIWPGCRL